MASHLVLEGTILQFFQIAVYSFLEALTVKYRSTMSIFLTLLLVPTSLKSLVSKLNREIPMAIRLRC